jgi:hypothetical protein
MKKLNLPAGITAALFLSAAPAGAATCSCATVPLLGTMELATPSKDKWLLASTYEYHDISDLVSGSSSVPDETGRDRTSQALILEASKGLSERWSVSLLGSFVEHDRRVGDAHDSASGLGDAIVMLKYSPRRMGLYSHNELSFGVGARLPIGANDEKAGDIVLAEDMQPGTGAWGGILWLYTARALNEAASARIYGNITYTYNDENDRNYRFGAESTAAFGVSYQTQTPWGFNGELLYRHTERDRRNDANIPNTGGEWLDFVAAAQYHVNEQTALRLSAKLPVSWDLNDALQFTTRYAARLTVTYAFGD